MTCFEVKHLNYVSKQQASYCYGDDSGGKTILDLPPARVHFK